MQLINLETSQHRSENSKEISEKSLKFSNIIDTLESVKNNNNADFNDSSRHSEDCTQDPAVDRDENSKNMNSGVSEKPLHIQETKCTSEYRVNIEVNFLIHITTVKFIQISNLNFV